MSDVDAVAFLQSIYRNEDVPLHVRMRAAIEAAHYERPKLAAMAVSHLAEGSFGDLLDKAIARSAPLKVIELKPEPTDNNVQHPAEELKKPFAKLRRV